MTVTLRLTRTGPLWYLYHVTVRWTKPKFVVSLGRHKVTGRSGKKKLRDSVTGWLEDDATTTNSRQDGVVYRMQSCAVAGVLGRRGFAVESAIARICREGGAHVSTNVFVRDLDLGAFNHLDGRRLEVVADGLSLFGGAQLAIDTTLVSTLRRDGTATRGAANRNGAAIQAAHRRKERTYPELVGEGGRARLVTLAGEVSGRWLIETANFLRALAVAKARDATNVMQASVELASAGGRASFHVRRHELSPILCWKSGSRVEREGTLSLPTMLSGTTDFDSCGVRRQLFLRCVCDLVVH